MPVPALPLGGPLMGLPDMLSLLLLPFMVAAPEPMSLEPPMAPLLPMFPPPAALPRFIASSVGPSMLPVACRLFFCWN